jgi:hypothetical protein
VQAGTLRQGEAFELETRWNAGSNRGHYTVRLEVLRGASLLASATAGFDIVAEPAVVTTIPAANAWSLIILTGLLGTAASYFLGKRRRTTQSRRSNPN